MPVALLTLAACDLPNFGAPDPVSDRGGDVLDLWRTSFVLAAAVTALVWGLVLWSVIRYRRRNDDLPSQTPYNIPIEILYTAVPLVIVAVLFALSVGVQRRVNEKVGRPDLRVEVIGFQWQWQFRYPGGVVVTGTPDEPPTMVLPVGSTVRFDLRSSDVNHSFFVPELLYKRDNIQGVDNVIDLKVTERGTWTGRCAEFCGLDHYRMTFTVEAVPRAEFEEWLDEQPVAEAA
jgi:cytochrome c oxidase subunit II